MDTRRPAPGGPGPGRPRSRSARSRSEGQSAHPRSAQGRSAHSRSPHSRSTQGRLRSLNIVMLLPPLVAVGAVLVAVDAETWWQAAVLSTGVAAAVVAFVRWAAGAFGRVALPCLLVSGAVWPYGVVEDCHTAFYGLSIVGPHVVSRLSRRRGAAATALVCYVAAVGAARLPLTPQGELREELILFLLLPTGVTGVLTGLMFPNQGFYDLVSELERSREREAELAVFRERVRFAGDLHDIQGHTLHVVKLKATLARKLVLSDPGRAEQELGEIQDLVGDTIAQTKQLAYAQRRLNLSAELENAKNLFEAAGIRVRVDREAEHPTDRLSRTGELLGQVLRETTTNVLRHTQATRVRITLSESGIIIVNDGARDGPLPELRGLSALRRRVAEDGGELTVEQEDGRFTTAAAFPHAAPARPATATGPGPGTEPEPGAVPDPDTEPNPEPDPDPARRDER